MSATAAESLVRGLEVLNGAGISRGKIHVASVGTLSNVRHGLYHRQAWDCGWHDSVVISPHIRPDILGDGRVLLRGNRSLPSRLNIIYLGNHVVGF
jgi:hypothetical protein